MQLKNSSHSYGWVAITLHWLLALFIFGLFGLGLYMVELSYYDSWYRGSLELHKSVGITLAILWILRLVWRQVNVQPEDRLDSHKQRLESLAAHIVHWMLYIIVVLLIVSGYLISTADGRAIAVFNLFEVPALPWSIDRQEDIAGEIHEILAWILVSFVAIHALAAIKHHILDKDLVLRRMLKPLSKPGKHI